MPARGGRVRGERRIDRGEDSFDVGKGVLDDGHLRSDLLRHCVRVGRGLGVALKFPMYQLL
jgi:hypothetical protein